jgi:hypothetical protein
MASPANPEHGDHGPAGRFRAYHAEAGSTLAQNLPGYMANLPPRLRCDRSLPACSSCLNRGEITACSYASRTSHEYDGIQKPLDSSEVAQKRIEDLEKLVLMVLENRRLESGEVGTRATCNDAVAMDTAHSKLISAVDVRRSNSRHIHGHARKDQIEGSRKPAQIRADFAQRHSVDDGYWTLLLEQVCIATLPTC